MRLFDGVSKTKQEIKDEVKIYYYIQLNEY